MNFSGILIGLYMLGVIGLGFYWVIKLEYHLGAHIWRMILALGILIVLISIFINDFFVSAIVGIFGGSMIWGSTELPEQEKRVRQGLFPQNPKKSNREQKE